MLDLLEQQERIITIELPTLGLKDAVEFITKSSHQGLSEDFIQKLARTTLKRTGTSSIGGLHMVGADEEVRASY